MKRAVFTALLALLTAMAGWGQAVSADQIAWRGRLPGMVSGIVARATVTQGSQSVYYWVVARYPIGVVNPAGPARAANTQGIAGINAMSPISVSWRASPGATGYDVIRGATPAFPGPGTCTFCLVSSNQAGTTLSDVVVAGAELSYPDPTPGVDPTILAQSPTLHWNVNNRDDDYPYLEVDAEVHFLPTRRPTGSQGNANLFGIGGLMTGTTAEKTYALGITVGRPPTSVATGDSNDALIRAVYSNYAANDDNFVINGLNSTVSNRAGNVGILQGGNINVANRATAPIVRGLWLSVDGFGTTTTEFSGLTVALKNEDAKAALEYGVKVLNDNNSQATAVDAAYMVRSSGALANLGFQYGLDMNGATIGTAELRTSVGNNIYSGTGVPAAGLCAAPTLGSIYLSTAGGGGTSLYVCEAPGAWAGK